MYKHETIDIKVHSDLYFITDCVVNVKDYQNGRRVFPCGDGCDHLLTAKESETINKTINGSPKAITVKLIYSDGDETTTRINASLEDAKRYYIGKTFNNGTVNDHMVKVIDIELLNDK